MDKTAFEKAIAYFGSQAKMAEALGVKPMAISHWKSRGIPPKRAIEIETASDGHVTRQELLPDLFGAAA